MNVAPIPEASMADLNALAVFAKVVEAGSFSEAARRLKMPISTVSRRIAELEDQLGVRLLERSTRNLRLTELGAEVLEHAIRSAELSEAVESSVSNRLSDVSGTLRLSSMPSVSDTLVAPLVTAFQAAYPDVRVQVLVTERLVDLIAEGVDLACRLGALKDSCLVARKLLTYRHRLVASPSYLKGREAPRKPQDLRNHRLLAFSHWKPENGWTFVHQNGRDRETLSFRPHLAMNDFAGLAPALVAGAGIGDLPPLVQPSLIEEGRLVEVMTDWRFRAHDLSLVHLANRHLSKPCRLFKDLAVQMSPTLFPNLPT
jgi:DNA-binding transcriptional LysR family regulator